MSRSIAGSTAVVTGASRGLGRAIALGLAAGGATVVLVARGREALDQVGAEISEAGGDAVVVATDLSTSAGVAPLLKAIAALPKAPSILVNAAGVFGPLGRFVDADPDAWIDTVAVNLFASVHTSRAIAPLMIANGRGTILNVTSAASLDPPGGLNSAYATSKVALNAFTRQLAAELAGTGVTANVFHPGDVKTEMFADIRSQVDGAGADVSASYAGWVRMVERTGGDPVSSSVDLVLRIATADDPPNGEFLWIENGLRPPIPSW